MLLSLWCRVHGSNLALDFLLDLIDCETRRALTGRIFHECIEESSSMESHPAHKESILDSPIVMLIGNDVGALVWVHTQIEELGYARQSKGSYQT